MDGSLSLLSPFIDRNAARIPFKLLFFRFFFYSLHLDASVNLVDDNSVLRLLSHPPTGKLPGLPHTVTLARARVVLLLVLLVAATALALSRSPGRGGPAAAAAAGTGGAAVVIAARAGVVAGAAGDVAEHVVHESALLVDAVVVVARDVHLDQFWARVVCLAVVVVAVVAGEVSE